MAKTLQQILGQPVLTGLIRGTTSGIPNPLPDEFSSIRRQVLGDTGRYTRITGTRTTSKLTKYGAPSIVRAMRDISDQPIKLMHSLESMSLDPMILQALRNYTSYEYQRMGQEEVARQVAEFRKNIDNLAVAANLSVLAQGAIYYDSNGNLLPSSTGATTSVTFGMNANNQNQLNGTIAVSWANPTADIPGQLRTLKKLAAKLTGYDLEYAFYAENIPSYITNNDLCNDYLARNPSLNDRYTNTGELADGLFGFKWRPIYTSFFEDQNGVNQTFFGANTIIFTPAPSSEWWEILDGSYPVPTTIDIQTDAAATIASFRLEYGLFSYAQPSHDPPGVKIFGGNTWIPALKVPDAIFQAQVSGF